MDLIMKIIHQLKNNQNNFYSGNTPDLEVDHQV